jgi:ATP-dependent protease ClpP protease subunit
MRHRDSKRQPQEHVHEQEQDRTGPLELAIVGDLTDNESELTDRLLGVEPGGECTIYFDSPGGSPYCGMSLVTLLRLRGIRATAVVTGECSSAALWPFAACQRRLVTPFSVFLFHPMKWQSEEHIGIREAAEWSRHFAELEQEMDVLLCDLFGRSADLINEWSRTHRYVTGREMVAAGLAELIDLVPLPSLFEQPRS